MKKIIIQICLFIFLIGCKQEKSNINQLNIKNDSKILEIDLKNRDLEKIILKGTNGQGYTIHFNSERKIAQIQNTIQIKNDVHVNTWITLDNLGNPDMNQTYYFITKMDQGEKGVFLKCRMERQLFKRSKFYILNGDFDENFELKSNINYDTMFFDKNGEVEIVMKKWHLGENFLKFILVEQNKDKMEKNYIYVNKRIYIKR